MTTEYIKREPGQLITAEDWNSLQIQIKEDIAKQVQDAVQKVDNVPNANNAHKLENQTPDELTKDILEKARQELPKRTGYKMLFRRLVWDADKNKGEENVITHDLNALPLVDIYHLDYFKVVCSSDDDKYEKWTNFYLYHTSERSIRFTPKDGKPKSIDVEPKDTSHAHPYRILFKDMLSLYKIEYTGSKSLDDLVTEFWKAFFADSNEDFDESHYCYSPWFHKCCCDNRKAADLNHGDWNDLWFQMRPRKSVAHLDFNYSDISTSKIIYPALAEATTRKAESIKGELQFTLTLTQATHFDFKTLGIKLLLPPAYPTTQTEDQNDGVEVITALEVPVMVLLKV